MEQRHQTSDSLFIDVDLSVWNSEQSLIMQVFNPSEVGCESNTDRTFDLTGPPVISSILPSELCDDGRTFVITGERFTNTSIVTVDGQSIDDVNFTDSTSLSITMPEGFGEGLFDVQVTNLDQCSDLATNSLDQMTHHLFFCGSTSCLFRSESTGYIVCF